MKEVFRCFLLGFSLAMFEHMRFVEDGGKLVIVNLQKTPKDSLAFLRIFATCDEVMVALLRFWVVGRWVGGWHCHGLIIVWFFWLAQTCC